MVSFSSPFSKFCFWSLKHDKKRLCEDPVSSQENSRAPIGCFSQCACTLLLALQVRRTEELPLKRRHVRRHTPTAAAPHHKDNSQPQQHQSTGRSPGVHISKIFSTVLTKTKRREITTKYYCSGKIFQEKSSFGSPKYSASPLEGCRSRTLCNVVSD